MISRRRLKRRLEDLEAAAEEVRDQLAELADDVEGRASSGDDDDQEEEDDEVSCASAEDVKSEIEKILAPVGHIQLTQTAHTDRIIRRIDSVETLATQARDAISRMEKQSPQDLLRASEALKKAANDLLKVPDVGVSSVFVVRHRGAGVSQMTGVFPATHLEEARALAASKPDHVVCAAVFHGSIRIGDVLP